jgi:hypothetical protein
MTPTGQEENKMNTNMMELNLDEMEMVNGGFDWDFVARGGCIGLALGCVAAGAIVLFCPPAGAVALTAAFAGTIAGSTGAGAGIGAAVAAATDD